MASAAFETGLNDVRRGIPFDWRIGGDDISKSWFYERGRHFGSVAPLGMQLRINGKLNPMAVALYGAASRKKFII
jgi:hypothetical protein